MSWLSFFQWFCLACGVLSVVCIVAGYPVIGSMGIVTFGLLGWGDHRSGRWPDSGGGDPAGVLAPVGRGPSSGSAAEAAEPPAEDAQLPFGRARINADRAS